MMNNIKDSGERTAFASGLWNEICQMGRRKRYLYMHDMWEDHQMSRAER